MILDKPLWVSHNGTSILSIDVQNSGKRFATAGLDQKVKVWSLPSVLDAKVEADASAPRLLSTLTDHFGSVNVARFARKADLLASGSDDKVVCIFALREGTGKGEYGSSDGPNLENWRLLYSLSGHRENITDLAWSPDDALLASCSLDNTIIIWDAKTGHRVKTLQGHTSYVKGLAWDPIGKYLASESDDKSVIIWRVSDWSVFQVISQPFVPPNSFVSNTFSLRLDWSPDGACLAAVNSFQSPKHVAPLLERHTWASPFSMVGHNGAVLCARHSPKLYYQASEGAGPPKLASCVALGSQDRKVSIWLSLSNRPLCVAAKVFRQGPVDLAWAPDGRSLLACSPDGTIAVFHFSEDELAVAPQEALDKKIKQLYGDMKARPTILAESALQLQLEADAQGQPRPQAPAEPSRALAARLAGAQGVPPNPAAANHTNGPPVRPNLTAAKHKEAPLQNGHHHSVGQPPAPSRSTPPKPLTAAPRAAQPAGAHPSTSPVRAGGRGRSTQPSPGHGRIGPAEVGEKRKANGPPPADRLPKRIAPQPAAPSMLGTPVDQVHPRAAHADARPGGQTAVAVGPPGYPIAPPLHPGPLTVDLGVDEEATSVFDNGARPRRMLEASNSGTPAAPQAQVTCTVGGKRLWTETLPGRVTALAGSPHFAAIGLQDGTLLAYTRAGRRMLPAMQLDAPLAFLASDGQWKLMALCANGSLRLWDLQHLNLITTTSALPLLGQRQPRPQVVKARLVAATGFPLLLMSDSTAAMFHLGMKTWMRLADNAFSSSSYASLAPSATLGELARVEGEAASCSGTGAVGLPSLALFQQSGRQASRAHLENRLACALALESGPEYRRWLLTYVRHLSNEGDQLRLREVCEELLGPLRPVDKCGAGEPNAISGNPGAWSRQVVGLDKRQLLAEVVRDMARNRALQRLATDFQDMLQEAQKPRG